MGIDLKSIVCLASIGQDDDLGATTRTWPPDGSCVNPVGQWDAGRGGGPAWRSSGQGGPVELGQMLRDWLHRRRQLASHQTADHAWVDRQGTHEPIANTGQETHGRDLGGELGAHLDDLRNTGIRTRDGGELLGVGDQLTDRQTRVARRTQWCKIGAQQIEVAVTTSWLGGLARTVRTLAT